MALPRAILFDLDDTLIRAYAQPEEAWRRLLGTFAESLNARDAAEIERVRAAMMDEAHKQEGATRANLHLRSACPNMQTLARDPPSSSRA